MPLATAVYTLFPDVMATRRSFAAISALVSASHIRCVIAYVRIDVGASGVASTATPPGLKAKAARGNQMKYRFVMVPCSGRI
jgi:hypothetical protein